MHFFTTRSVWHIRTHVREGYPEEGGSRLADGITRHYDDKITDAPVTLINSRNRASKPLSTIYGKFRTLWCWPSGNQNTGRCPEKCPACCRIDAEALSSGSSGALRQLSKGPAALRREKLTVRDYKAKDDGKSARAVELTLRISVLFPQGRVE